MIAATPLPGKTKPISATTTNAVIELTVDSPQLIFNMGLSNTVEIYYRTGATAAEAVAVVASSEGDYPLVPGAVQVVTKPDNHRFVGVITPSGTATGWVSPAHGN